MDRQDPFALSPFGILIAGTAGFLFLLAFFTARPVLAFVAVAITAFLFAARHAHEQATVQLTRHLDEHPHLGDRVRIITTATSDTPVLLHLESPLPQGLEERTRHTKAQRHRAQESLVATPVTPGTHRLPPVQVESRDRWGLWERRHRIETDQEIHVTPEARWSKADARAKATTIAKLVTSRWATQPDPVVHTVREFHAGDRLKDIDWAHSTRGAGIFTREKERVALRPVILLLDATHTMRWLRRTSKLTTASRITIAVVATARRAGAQTGLVAFTDTKVHHATGEKGTIKGTLRRLAQLPAHQDPQNGHPSTPPPVTAALTKTHALSGAPALILAILDAEIAPKRTIAMLERLQQQGHDCILVIPATGAHHYTRPEAKKQLQDTLRGYQVTRQEVKLFCRHHQIPVIISYPEAERELVAEVSERRY